MIELGGKVFAADQAWRMPFFILGTATLLVGLGITMYFRGQERGLPYARAALHLGGYAAGGLAAVMAVYFIGDAAGLSDIAIAVCEVALAVALVFGVFARKGGELGPVLRSRDLMLINFAFIAVLWNLWFFSFWSVSIVADAAHSSFGRSALIAAFNAGAGIIGFPIGGWLSDVAVRRGIGRKRLVVVFTALQCLLTVAFGLVITGGAPSVWVMAALLFGASTFFNAMQPIAQAMIADIADPAHYGAAFGMNNLIGETGAVLSPAVSGVLRDATGAWSAAVFLDAGLIAMAVILFLFVREAATSQVLGRAAGAGHREQARSADPAVAAHRRVAANRAHAVCQFERARVHSRLVPGSARRICEHDRRRVTEDELCCGARWITTRDSPVWRARSIDGGLESGSSGRFMWIVRGRDGDVDDLHVDEEHDPHAALQAGVHRRSARLHPEQMDAPYARLSHRGGRALVDLSGGTTTTLRPCATLCIARPSGRPRSTSTATRNRQRWTKRTKSSTLDAWTPSPSTKPRRTSRASSRAPRPVRRSWSGAGRRPWRRSSPTTRRPRRACPAR